MFLKKTATRPNGRSGGCRADCCFADERAKAKKGMRSPIGKTGN